MKKDSIAYKVVLLGVLCGVCGLLLGAVNNVTEPLIAAASLQTELANLELIYPGATFAEVTDYTDDSGVVTGVYSAEGLGYVYKCTGMGYSSNGFTFLVAINNDGTIGGYTVLEESETSGFGKRCFEDDYTNQILALTVDDDVPLLSGATLTSTAVKQGIEAAEAIFNATSGN